MSKSKRLPIPTAATTATTAASSSINESITKDHHPIPQEYADLDQVAMPLVIPARLEQIRFDFSNANQTTYLDCRGRLRTELIKVVGTDFWRQVVVGEIDVYGRSGREAGLPRTTIGDNWRSCSAGAINARQTIMEAYLASECVAALATMYYQLYSQKGAALAADGKRAAATPCPGNLRWTCAYTPCCINNNYTSSAADSLSSPASQESGIALEVIETATHESLQEGRGNTREDPLDHPGSAGYWAIEASLCHYNMFALFLQLTFLQLHIDRPSAYLPGRAYASKRRAIRAQSNALGCLAHLKYIQKHWSDMRFENLAHVGLIPDANCFERYYRYLIELLHLNYCIFFTMLPLHSDNPGVSTSQHAASIDEIVLPSRSEYMPSVSHQPLSATGISKQEWVEWYREVLANVALALKNARDLHDSALSQSSYPTNDATTLTSNSINKKEVALASSFRKRLTLNHSYMAFVIKYVRQAEHVFRLLYRALRVKLALLDPGCAEGVLLLPKARMQILRQVTELAPEDPEFCLCIGNIPEGQPFSDIDFDSFSEMQTLYPLGAGPEGELHHREAVLRTVPAGFLHSKISVSENEVRRTNVAIPGEVYRCDFAFSTWRLNTFAQFPPAFMTSLRILFTGIHNIADMICDEKEQIDAGSRRADELRLAQGGVELTNEQRSESKLFEKREAQRQVERALNSREIDKYFESAFQRFTVENKVMYEQLEYSPSHACKEFIRGVLKATKQTLQSRQKQSV